MNAEPVESMTDRAAEAFRDYQEGAAERMADLVDLLTPTLWHVARACRLDRQSAEDVVQVAWMRLVEHADGIEESQAIVAWLVTTVRRESWRVSKQAQRTRPDDFEDDLDPLQETLVGPRQAPDPAEVATLEDRRRRLWEHIATLTPRCQQLLRIICFAESPNYAAISQDLGMPVGSIGPTRGRCLATLRKALLSDPHWSAS
ncbi:RNA polymerase sigma factor [Ornithinimicrobium sediminis]|uniref:RNA polymerase sigma factor n=1 Tax=Ornithinimicrobium sediminis TaxID=2904603 RepID=UPI001E4289C5|nr:sigma-70 family RNA polymerase sigma factor [Ornithinimicrobium sediminis]MCE0487126.1 sigma-70 family RNA polymerase sigma factor [Ornithinimicrobium sediminis]